MRNFFSYPSTGQFANAIRHTKEKCRFKGLTDSGEPIFNNKPLPKVLYRGTVKLHGTNSGIVLDLYTGDFTFQSRERVLTIEQDNAGFMLAQLANLDVLKTIFAKLNKHVNPDATKIVLFGEWCGGNIQKGVAITGLSKMMVLFGVKVIMQKDDGSDDYWLDDLILGEVGNYPESGIYSILHFPTYFLEIDFERPDLAQNELVNLVAAVENSCPVGLAFGVDSTGEGLVWKPVMDGSDSGTWFKSKGSKHSASKVKTISAVDSETFDTINDYVEMFVTENRLEQMLDVMVREKLLPFDMKSMGDFLRLLINDCIKESQEELVANQLDPKKLGGPIANAARRWYINKVNSTV
jgi:hypothetical protein